MATGDQRLRSIDILRGFDMFWIIGGDYLVSTLAKDVKSPLVENVAAQFMEHVEWEGFRFYDMIFPLFLFLIGVVLPFSVGKRLEAASDRKAVLKKVAVRTLTLFVLGLVYNGALQFSGWDHLRYCGVLPRLAIGYGVASLFAIYTKPRTQVIAVVGILLSYWAILGLNHAPGSEGPYTQWGNIANYVDRLTMHPGQMCFDYGDPEDLVSTLPAFATALLGLLTGQWLKNTKDEKRRLLGLVAAGVVCIALGAAWSPLFPIIKKLWTSSYVLVAGGFSMLLVALFHYLFDVRGWHRWALPFTVIGMNSILIYMLSSIVDFNRIASFFLGGAANHFPSYGQILIAAGMLVVKIGLLYFLYRQKVFLRV